MTPITLTLSADDAVVVERLLLKLQAAELSDLRRAQSQMAIYGDRRASMAGEPGAIESRLEVIKALLNQVQGQLRPTAIDP